MQEEINLFPINAFRKTKTENVDSLMQTNMISENNLTKIPDSFEDSNCIGCRCAPCRCHCLRARQCAFPRSCSNKEQRQRDMDSAEASDGHN